MIFLFDNNFKLWKEKQFVGYVIWPTYVKCFYDLSAKFNKNLNPITLRVICFKCPLHGRYHLT